MTLASARAAFHGWRGNRRRQGQLAYVLWLLLAVVVWNVVFDRVLVLAGRRYSYTAANAFAARQPPVLIAPWMTAARADAARLATEIAVPIALAGLAAVTLALRRGERSRGQ